MAEIDRVLDRFDLRTIEAALARKRTREKRTQRALEAKRRKLERELRRLTEMTGSRASAKAAPGGRRRKAARAKAAGKGRKASKARRPNARRLNDITLAEALHRVMVGRSKPVHYKELADTVLKRGLYRTKSKNLLPTVMVTLTRDNRFKRVEPGMFALK